MQIGPARNPKLAQHISQLWELMSPLDVCYEMVHKGIDTLKRYVLQRFRNAIESKENTVGTCRKHMTLT